jgi:FAD:protein FMN transferase
VIIRTIILLAFFILPIACSDTAGVPVILKGMTMGTTYSITFASDYQNKHSELEDGVTSIFEDINQKMSTYIPDSEISLINLSESTDFQNISDELYLVIKTAMDINNKTNGAFDITIGSIVNLWGFGPGDAAQTIPDPDELDSRLNNSGQQHIQLRENPFAFKKARSDLQLDLSAIAKGYGVDAIASYLEQQGINDYLVEIGGEIKARGLNSKEQIWRIGIEKPLVNTREIHRTISLNNMAMATSGDYRNFFNYQGTRYSHTIDPVTGWPVLHANFSVTVLHTSTMIADALATALTVKGPENGFDFAESQGIAAMFVVINNDVITEKYTASFIPYLNE